MKLFHLITIQISHHVEQNYEESEKNETRLCDRFENPSIVTIPNSSHLQPAHLYQLSYPKGQAN